MLFMFQHISQYARGNSEMASHSLQHMQQSSIIKGCKVITPHFFSITLNICFISVFSISLNISDTISPKNQIFEKSFFFLFLEFLPACFPLSQKHILLPRHHKKPSFLKTYALKSLKFCQRFFIWEQMHIVTHAARSNNDAAATA